MDGSKCNLCFLSWAARILVECQMKKKKKKCWGKKWDLTLRESTHFISQHCFQIFCELKVTQSCPTHCDPMAIQTVEFSRPEYWTGQPVPFPGDPANPRIKLRAPEVQAYSLPAEPQGKPKNTGMSGSTLLQRIFPTQEFNWGLLHYRQILYQLRYQEAQPLKGSSIKSSIKGVGSHFKHTENGCSWL